MWVDGSLIFAAIPTTGLAPASPQARVAHEGEPGAVLEVVSSPVSVASFGTAAQKRWMPRRWFVPVRCRRAIVSLGRNDEVLEGSEEDSSRALHFDEEECSSAHKNGLLTVNLVFLWQLGHSCS